MCVKSFFLSNWLHVFCCCFWMDNYVNVLNPFSMCILYLNNLIFDRVCDIAHLLQTCMSDCLPMINTVIYCDTVSSNTLDWYNTLYTINWSETVNEFFLPQHPSILGVHHSASFWLSNDGTYEYVAVGLKTDWNTDTPLWNWKLVVLQWIYLVHHIADCRFETKPQVYAAVTLTTQGDSLYCITDDWFSIYNWIHFHVEEPSLSPYCGHRSNTQWVSTLRVYGDITLFFLLQ